jgi:type IV pilus assembly protein PilC
VKFNYQARTKEGKIETGTIEASSKESAALLLQKYNVFITSLEEQEVKSPFFVGIHLEKRISKKDLIIFFRQLSIMLESRVPIVQSLSSLSFQTRKVNFKKVIAKISSLVESGVPLSDALANYPQIFGNFYIALVKSGELSGKISDSLSQIADHLEREDDVVAQVRQAMIYPLFVVCVLFVVVSIIIVEVMPQITNLIKESHSNLSFSSSLTLNIYGFLGSYWWVLVSAIILAILVIGYYISTKSGNQIK